jgi:hypothetical protein
MALTRVASSLISIECFLTAFYLTLLGSAHSGPRTTSDDVTLGTLSLSCMVVFQHRLVNRCHRGCRSK